MRTKEIGGKTFVRIEWRNKGTNENWTKEWVPQENLLTLTSEWRYPKNYPKFKRSKITSNIVTGLLK